MELDWNNVPELPPQQRFSCIIAADVIHEDAHAPLVSRVIRVRALACQKKNCKDFLLMLTFCAAYACTIRRLSRFQCRCP
jgi:hypothetical protein